MKRIRIDDIKEPQSFKGEHGLFHRIFIGIMKHGEHCDVELSAENYKEYQAHLIQQLIEQKGYASDDDRMHVLNAPWLLFKTRMVPRAVRIYKAKD